MSNPTTSNQWTRIAERSGFIIRNLNAQSSDLSSKIGDLNVLETQLKAQPGEDAQRELLRVQLERESLFHQREEIRRQSRLEENKVLQANEQARKAQEGPPNSSTNTPPVEEPTADVSPPASNVGEQNAQKFSFAADQAQQQSTRIENNLKSLATDRRQLLAEYQEASANQDTEKEAILKSQLNQLDRDFAALNTQLAESNETRDRAINLANASAANPTTSTVPAPVGTLQTEAGGNVSIADGSPVRTGSNQITTTTSAPVKIESDADFEARIEQERLAALVATNQSREENPNQPPIITQGPPAGSGIPSNPLDDEGNLLPGWAQGPNGTVAYVGIDAATNSGALLTKAPIVLPTSILPYDDDGNLQPGWKLGADGLPFRDPNYPGGGPPVLPERSPYPVDDNGNLMPGWTLDATGENYIHDPAYNSVDLGAEAVAGIKQSRSQGITGEKAKAQASGTAKAAPIKNLPDWRVRLQLAPQANYLYKDPTSPGILAPLKSTNGILFPYLPTVSVGYSAAYDAQSLVHSNYKVVQYTGSSVDNVSVNAEFTAQSTEEANYLLAVIHFFRTITKMFYGQDKNPQRGTPPPLCYLTGFGQFQYSNHPLLITGFTYNLPTDVDYIRADSQSGVPGTNQPSPKTGTNTNNAIVNRTATSRVPKGGMPLKPQWQKPQTTDGVTYVPTKMAINFSAIPVITRADISRAFSVKDYAAGKLTSGKLSPRGRGIW